MAKRSKGKKPRVKNRVNRDFERYARDFYYWRYHEDSDNSPLMTHKALVGKPYGHADKKIEQLMEYDVQHQDLIWHCLTITYCRDPWGREYLSPGYAKSTTRLKLANDSVEPIMQAALGMSEENLNQKHVYARGVVISPRSPENHDIMALAKAQREGLHLSLVDLENIDEVLNQQEYTYLECDRIDNLDLEEKIALLL